MTARPILPRRYEGRVAVVTGAGSGIGKAIAERLDAEGATVVANDLHAEGLAALRGDRIHPVVADVASEDTPDLIVRAAQDVGNGRIDALFNNAGIAADGPAEDLTEQSWRRVMSINVDASFRMAQAVGRVMIEHSHGAILNTASTAGFAGMPSRIAYVVSKHALVGLTRGLAVEWGQYGIRVNAIAPGLAASGMNAEVRAERAWAWQERESRTPLLRSGTPADQAATALFLNSDEAGYTTGQVAVVDGGQLSLFSGYLPAYRG